MSRPAMSPEPSLPAPGRSFPIGLTITVAIALAILVALGVWQVRRLAWKQAVLAHIAALKDAPPQPLAQVMARAARGEDVSFTRVSVTCLTPDYPPSAIYLRGVAQVGAFRWRPLSACRIAADGYTMIPIDRGEVPGDAATTPPTRPPAPPRAVVGVLRKPEKPTAIEQAITRDEDAGGGFAIRGHALAALEQATGARSPDLMIVAEREDPAPAGVTAAPLPPKIPNNHLSYALTWFGLAGALLAVYAAMLFRRFKPA